MAALLPRLPWLPLVVGVEKVASRDLPAAGARLFTALLTCLQLAFGVALGTRLILHGVPLQAVASVGMSALEHTCALLIALRVLCLQLLVASADLPWVFAAGVVGYACARLGSGTLGVELGAFCAALMVGVLANAVARWCERPARLLSVPGMFALWPGALGLRGVNSLWMGAPMGGAQQGLSVAMMALGAVTGLLVAAHLVPSKSALSD